MGDDLPSTCRHFNTFPNRKNVPSLLRHSFLGNEDSDTSHLEPILFHNLLGCLISSVSATLNTLLDRL